MKFSIGIPAYKSKYLKECIDSILSQIYKDFEIVIVNDASPEDIDSIVKSYSDSRIRYYKNAVNCGAVNVVDNWNKCLSYAEGDFIICMGDDDKLLPNCLEEFNSMINKYPNLDVYHAWTEIIDEKSEFVKLQEARPELESVYSMIWHRWNGRIQFIGDFLFRTEALKQKGGFYKLPLAWASDDITSFILASEKGIVNSQVPLFQYRVNSNTISNTGNIEEKMNAIELEKKWYADFLSYETMNTMDMKYRKMLLSENNIFFIKKKIFRIKIDLLNNPFFRLSFWIKNKKKFGVSYGMIMKGLIEALPISLGIIKKNNF